MIWGYLSRPKAVIWATAAVVSSVAAVATAQGIGVTPDGVTYLRLADSFARRHELHVSVPWVSPTHFPPGWSILVGVASWASGLSVLQAARVVNIVAAGALVVVLGRAMTWPSGRTSWSAAAGTASVALLYQLHVASTNALTEPVFLVVLVAALLALEHFNQTHSDRLLLLSASLIASATLVRYVGVALVVPLAWSVVRLNVRLSERITKLSWAGAAAIGPVGLWVLAAPDSSAESIHARSGGDTAGMDEAIESLAGLVTSYVRRPAQLGVIPWTVSVVTVAVLVLVLVRRDLQRCERWPTPPVAVKPGSTPWMLFGLSYLVTIAAQRWWIDREVIARYWLPAVAVFAVVAVRHVEAWTRSGSLSRSTMRVLLAVVLLGTAWNVAWIVRSASLTSSSGIGYNHLDFAGSEIIETLRSLEETEVLTDNPPEVSYHAPSLSPRNLMSDPVRDVDCAAFDWATVESATQPTAIVLMGRCDKEAIVDRLEASLPGVTVTREPGVGTLLLWTS